MVDTSLYTTEEHLVSVWVHEKGQSNQRYDEKEQNLTCTLISQLWQANLHKLKKETFLTSSVLDVTQSGRSQKYADADVSAHLEESVLHHHHQWHYSTGRALASLTGFRDG
jgi:hypothetical protein